MPVLEEEPPPPKRPRLQASDSPSRADLAQKSIGELCEMLKELFIKTKSRSKKPLVDALLDHFVEAKEGKEKEERRRGEKKRLSRTA